MKKKQKKSAVKVICRKRKLDGNQSSDWSWKPGASPELTAPVLDRSDLIPNSPQSKSASSENVLVTPTMMSHAQGRFPSHSAAQVKLAQEFVGNRAWRKKIVGAVVPRAFWEGFCAASENRKSINIRKAKTKKISNSARYNPSFYTSEQWRALRFKVLSRYECKCMMCGRSPRDHSIVLHVDHIKPRSKHPELSLCFDNLQILCEDCNLGKGNTDDTDYRPRDRDCVDERLDAELLSSGQMAGWL